MTLVELAKGGQITPLMEQVAAAEGISPQSVAEGIASGRVVIPSANPNRKGVKAVGIGQGLRTKVNASVGTSTDVVDPAMELEKAQVAQRYGADCIMDLSVGGPIEEIRRSILDGVSLPVGTVPLYEAFAIAIERYGAAVDMPEELLWDVMERQCEEGVGFMAIHCGINRMTIEMLRRQGYRYGGLVSKGGSYLVAWMEHKGRENPLYEHFDRVVDILKRHDVVLSLGNGFRAGAIADSTDRVQIQELLINCELAELGHSMGCQTMVEGPGHIPIDEIEANIVLQKRMSGGSPFYMLGPITTDIAPGYDHITAAIGAAMSSAFGADFICYVTPAEHLGLPQPEDVKEGVIAARIAAHVGDMVKFGRRERDKAISKARRNMDWQEQFRLAIDPEGARRIKQRLDGASCSTAQGDGCTMCGSFCAHQMLKDRFTPHMEGTDKL